MSLIDFEISSGIAGDNHPFDALIMAAMRQGTEPQIMKLALAFPEIFKEFHECLHASEEEPEHEIGDLINDGVINP